MILVMPENESFQFQSGYFPKLKLKNQPHDLVKYMWKIVIWSFFLMFLNILMYLFLLIRLYCKILIKTKIETWKMIFQICNHLIFQKFPYVYFLLVQKCNCLVKIVLDRFWHLCWQRKYSIKKWGILCFCLSSYFLSPNLIHTLYFIKFYFPSVHNNPG